MHVFKACDKSGSQPRNHPVRRRTSPDYEVLPLFVFTKSVLPDYSRPYVHGVGYCRDVSSYPVLLPVLTWHTRSVPPRAAADRHRLGGAGCLMPPECPNDYGTWPWFAILDRRVLHRVLNGRRFSLLYRNCTLPWVCSSAAAAYRICTLQHKAMHMWKAEKYRFVEHSPWEKTLALEQGYAPGVVRPISCRQDCICQQKGHVRHGNYIQYSFLSSYLCWKSWFFLFLLRGVVQSV